MSFDDKLVCPSCGESSHWEDIESVDFEREDYEVIYEYL
jgi:hypothetical protein